jgi:hypothetical protein
VGALAFINIHAPTDNSHNSKALFDSLHPHLALPISLLLGVFNSFIYTIDSSSTASLFSLLHLPSFPLSFYCSLFCVLHPTAKVYYFHRLGCEATRLDRFYLPPLLESQP